MTDRDLGPKPANIGETKTRLVTPEEAARLLVDDLPVEPKEWAEAWHREAGSINKPPTSALMLEPLSRGTTFRVLRGKKNGN